MIEINWAGFILGSLAVWRLSHLLSQEDGPFDMVISIRKRLGNGFFGKLLDCFYCLSLWVALPFAFYLANTFFEGVLVWLGLSGGACIIYKMSEKNGG